ncbi:hypothetical protein Tco_0356422 [Tanacetum coccineum]
MDANKKFDLVNPQYNNNAGFVDAPTFSQMVPFFLDDLGFSLQLRSPSNFMSKGLPQPWQTLFKIFARCLTTRVTGHDQPPFQIMQMLYFFINNVHVDYVELLWEGLYYSLTHPTTLIPYLRFTKIIVNHYMTEHPDILRRVTDNYHRVENDDLLSDHYQMYVIVFRVDVPTTHAQRKPTVIRFRVPLRRQYPETPIPTPAEIDVTNLAETIQMSIATQRRTHNVDAFMDDVLNSKKDPDIRIEPRSDKESPKVTESADILTIHDKEVKEESTGDEFKLRKRENGNGIEETRDTPLPTPIRSPSTHIALLSSDKETLQELTVTTEDAPSSADKEKLQELTVTDSTSSSSSPKPKTGRFRQLIRLRIRYT